MRAIEKQWEYKVERGPDWLFVKLVPPENCETQSPQIGTKIWDLLQRHTAHRVVIEMDQVASLPSQFLGELVTLQKQITEHQGVMRLSGLNAPCLEQMTAEHLNEQLPAYPTRAEAVFAKRAASAL